jgi:mono/diheme cytochrome c family protein
MKKPALLFFSVLAALSTAAWSDDSGDAGSLPKDVQRIKEVVTAARKISGWQAPQEADALKNPLTNHAEGAAQGKILYKKSCAICHGDKGEGDGAAGIGLTPRPADHTSPKFQSLSDGAIFWKITEGKSPMPSYKATLSDTQRWQLVDFIRVLGKKK